MIIFFYTDMILVSNWITNTKCASAAKKKKVYKFTDSMYKIYIYENICIKLK